MEKRYRVEKKIGAIEKLKNACDIDRERGSVSMCLCVSLCECVCVYLCGSVYV